MALNTILCPIDLSGRFHAVLAYAASLAETLQARLRIIHVMEGGGPLATARTLIQDLYRKSVSEAIRERIANEVLVVEGNVAREIVGAADDSSVDLIVMGFHRGRQMATHCLDRVLTATGKPVLALADSLDPKIAAKWRRIVAATALDTESAGTHSVAGALAEIAGAGLTVVHVIQDLPPAIMAPEAFPLPSYRDFALEEATRELDQAFQPATCRPAGLVICGGDVSQEIVRVAEREQADLLIVGFRSGSRHLLGTVADRVLNRANCPVLAVPHPGARGFARAA